MDNLFTSLAKGLASFLIKRKIGTQMDALANDPEVIEAMESMKQAQANADKLLADYCKIHPNDPKCREYFKNKNL